MKHDLKYRKLSIEDGNKQLVDWRNAFHPIVLGKYESLWHSFSFNHIDCMEGVAAVSEFEKTYLKDFLVFIVVDAIKVIECNANSIHLPFSEFISALEKIQYCFDIIVSHKNFNWTFVVTHEQNLGPYFAYSSSRGK